MELEKLLHKVPRRIRKAFNRRYKDKDRYPRLNFRPEDNEFVDPDSHLIEHIGVYDPDLTLFLQGGKPWN